MQFDSLTKAQLVAVMGIESDDPLAKLSKAQLVAIANREAAADDAPESSSPATRKGGGKVEKIATWNGRRSFDLGTVEKGEGGKRDSIAVEVDVTEQNGKPSAYAFIGGRKVPAVYVEAIARMSDAEREDLLDCIANAKACQPAGVRWDLTD